VDRASGETEFRSTDTLPALDIRCNRGYSTANSVLRKGRVLGISPTRILLATDGSPHAEQAAGDVAIAHLKFGEHPDEAIVHLAEDIGADLIVIGSPGFGGLRRALMGNVADYVARHAHCPVTVVRPAEEPDERRSLLHRLIPSSFVGPS